MSHEMPALNTCFLLVPHCGVGASASAFFQRVVREGTFVVPWEVIFPKVHVSIETAARGVLRGTTKAIPQLTSHLSQRTDLRGWLNRFAFITASQIHLAT